MPRRRKCSKCGTGRSEKFYASPRARVCTHCKRSGGRQRSHATHVEVTYGITEDEYQQILAAQGGVCAICEGSRGYNLHVDHDHALERQGVPTRNTVRGLLCRACNARLLPAARDKVATLERAIVYLNDPPAFRVLR